VGAERAVPAEVFAISRAEREIWLTQQAVRGAARR